MLSIDSQSASSNGYSVSLDNPFGLFRRCVATKKSSSCSSSPSNASKSRWLFGFPPVKPMVIDCKLPVPRLLTVSTLFPSCCLDGKSREGISGLISACLAVPAGLQLAQVYAFAKLHTDVITHSMTDNIFACNSQLRCECNVKTLLELVGTVKRLVSRTFRHVSNTDLIRRKSINRPSDVSVRQQT